MFQSFAAVNNSQANFSAGKATEESLFFIEVEMVVVA